jgi:Uma2 family endonuclease
LNAVPQHRMTADEYIAWAMETGFRGALVDGAPVAMAPERVGHARVKFRAARALEDAVLRAGLRCEVLPDGMAVVVEGATVYEPDALVRCGDPLPPDAVKVTDPLILIEVLSPSTSSIDTGNKLGDYFRISSVRHYLILRTEKRSVIHHARAADGGIATRILHDGLLVLDPPGLTLEIAALFPPA